MQYLQGKLLKYVLFASSPTLLFFPASKKGDIMTRAKSPIMNYHLPYNISNTYLPFSIPTAYARSIHYSLPTPLD